MIFRYSAATTLMATNGAKVLGVPSASVSMSMYNKYLA